MMVSDKILLDAFRSSLPESHNREMWVNETYLEYSRLRLLRHSGVGLRPVEGSLMSLLLSLEVEVEGEVSEVGGLDAYKENFGHSPTYCWTTSISELALRLAASCTSPGTSWVGGDA